MATTTTASTQQQPQPPQPPPGWEVLAERAAAVLAIEETARRAFKPFRLQLQMFSRRAMSAWVRATGGLHNPANPIEMATVTAEVLRGLEDLDPGDVQAKVDKTVDKALATGWSQTFDELDALAAFPGVELSDEIDDLHRHVDLGRSPLDMVARREINRIDRAMRDQLAAAAREAYGLGDIGRWSEVADIVARATQAATGAERIAHWAVNWAANQGSRDAAARLGFERVWIAERNACFIPSTRVLAPTVLVEDPAGAAGGMTGDPLDGLPLDPPARSLTLGSDPGPSAASAVAGPVRDRFRAVEAVSSREYVGDVVRIRTASGKELTGTPNHPIATRSGWIPLGQLKVGDHVFSRRSGQRIPLGVHPDDDAAPPTIEQVAEAFPVPVGVVPTAAEDFHGDGVGSDIHVVRADSLLLDQIDASCPEHGRQLDLQRRDLPLMFLVRAGLRFLRSLRPTLAAVLLGKQGSDFAALIGTPRSAAAEIIARGHTCASEPSPHGVHVDSVGHGYFLGRLAPFVEPDEIVDVWRGEFRGHVYNLQTTEGWYLADGIAAHNCVVCLALSGEVSRNGAFSGDATYGSKPMPVWPPHMPLYQPPRHPGCRCRAEVFRGSVPGYKGPDLPAALRREAERSILTGWRLPSESESVRLVAARNLLARGTNLPKSVQQRARLAVARSAFGPHPRPRRAPSVTH